MSEPRIRIEDALRNYAQMSPGTPWRSRCEEKAADEIQSLRQRVERLEGALREANEKFEAIIGIASGCSQTHGDPGGGLEMIHAEACQGAGVTLSAQFTAI